MKARFAAAIAAISISCSAQAVLVDMTELPASMQTCFSYGGTCWGSSVISTPMPGATASLISSYDLPNMSAFQYTDGTTDKWLLRYTLATPSQENGMALTGHAWMSVNQTYDLSNTSNLFPPHALNFFTEKVIPLPSTNNFSDGIYGINLTASDLLAGSAYLKITYDWSAGYSWQGNLYINENGRTYPPESNVDATFNLLYLNYQNIGGFASLGFNPSDTRALLFKQTISYNDPWGYGNYYHNEAYFAGSPVPLPASFWFLASGLMGLGGLARANPSRVN